MHDSTEAIEPALSTQGGLVPSRRAIIKTAAWSVPVIMLAAATPAAATSVDLPPQPFTLANFWGSNFRTEQPDREVFHYASRTEWNFVVLSLANFESPVTTAPITLTFGPVADFDVDFDPTATVLTAPAVGGNPSYDTYLNNSDWNLTIAGGNAYFVSNVTLEPGFSGVMPNQATVGFWVKAKATAPASTFTLNLTAHDAVTVDGPTAPLTISIV